MLLWPQASISGIFSFPLCLFQPSLRCRTSLQQRSLICKSCRVILFFFSE